LGEEFGELTKAVLQTVYEQEPNPHFYQEQLDAVREEAIQTAAMAIRFIMSLDDYKYVPQPQHEQAAIDAAGGGGE
jgi:hypothetical protein